jgi:hypothetical protein
MGVGAQAAPVTHEAQLPGPDKDGAPPKPPPIPSEPPTITPPEGETALGLRFRGAIADHQAYTLSRPAKACRDRQDKRFDGRHAIYWHGGRVGTLDTIAVRLSHTEIWASPTWICWTKDCTSSRSSSDASVVQRSASFADRSSTARWAEASRPSGATASLTSAPDAKSARITAATFPNRVFLANVTSPLSC